MKALSALMLSIIMIFAMSTLILPDVSAQSGEQIVMVEQSAVSVEWQATVAVTVSPPIYDHQYFEDALELKLKYVPVEYPLRA